MYSLEDLKRKKNGVPNSHSLLKTDGNQGLSLVNKDLKMSLGLGKDSKTQIEKKVDKMAHAILPSAAQNLKDNQVHIIFFLDKSYSCHGTEPATIAGYKELILKERKQGMPTYVTTILFEETYLVLNKRVRISDVPDLCYRADGDGTNIFDTLICNLNQLKQEFCGEKTIVAIMTDGVDNRSVKNDANETRKVIQACETLGWEFIFLGANSKSLSMAQQIGVKTANMSLFNPTLEGYYKNFLAIAEAVKSYRSDGKVNPDWSQVIRTENKSDNALEQHDDGPILRIGRK